MTDRRAEALLARRTIAERAAVDRLEKEADWLARALVERGHIIGDITSKNFVAEWRNAARKALEEEA